MAALALPGRPPSPLLASRLGPLDANATVDALLTALAGLIAVALTVAVVWLLLLRPRLGFAVLYAGTGSLGMLAWLTADRVAADAGAFWIVRGVGASLVLVALGGLGWFVFPSLAARERTPPAKPTPSLKGHQGQPVPPPRVARRVLVEAEPLAVADRLRAYEAMLPGNSRVRCRVARVGPRRSILFL